MSISQLNGSEGPPDSAVQNRLTAAGLVLMTLFFAGSFALALNAQSEVRRSFVATFGYLEVAMVVGALLTIVAITSFLTCQQCIASDHSWYKSKRAWFSVGCIALYLSLSQAMSAGLTELVFGLNETFKAELLAKIIALAATLLWVVLLFVAPIHTIRSWWKHFTMGEKRMVVLMYLTFVIFVLITNTSIYVIQDGVPDTIREFLFGFVCQLFQPMMWLDPWGY